MTSKKRRYGVLSEMPPPSSDPDLIDDVFEAFTGKRTSDAPSAAPPAGAEASAVSATRHPLPAPAPSAAPAPGAEVGGHWPISNDVTDRLWPVIRDPYAQSVLVQLLRLSWGFHRDECTIGLPKLAERCGFNETQARKGKRILIGMGLVEELGQDNTNKDNSLRGMLYRILIKPPPGAKVAPGAAPPNKEKLSKNSIKATVCDRCREHPGWYYPDPTNKKRGMLPCNHGEGNNS
jgi:hypothetical protein